MDDEPLLFLDSEKLLGCGLGSLNTETLFSLQGHAHDLNHRVAGAVIFHQRLVVCLDIGCIFNLLEGGIPHEFRKGHAEDACIGLDPVLLSIVEPDGGHTHGHGCPNQRNTMQYNYAPCFHAPLPVQKLWAFFLADCHKPIGQKGSHVGAQSLPMLLRVVRQRDLHPYGNLDRECDRIGERCGKFPLNDFTDVHPAARPFIALKSILPAVNHFIGNDLAASAYVQCLIGLFFAFQSAPKQLVIPDRDAYLQELKSR